MIGNAQETYEPDPLDNRSYHISDNGSRIYTINKDNISSKLSILTSPNAICVGTVTSDILNVYDDTSSTNRV